MSDGRFEPAITVHASEDEYTTWIRCCLATAQSITLRELVKLLKGKCRIPATKAYKSITYSQRWKGGNYWNQQNAAKDLSRDFLIVIEDIEQHIPRNILFTWLAQDCGFMGIQVADVRTT